MSGQRLLIGLQREPAGRRTLRNQHAMIVHEDVALARRRDRICCDPKLDFARALPSCA